jgi:serine/threonine-protein kinase
MDRDPTSQHGRFLPGTQFGRRYRIVGLLGRGGMGEVYRADDLELGQTVALKLLPRGLWGDEAALTLLKNEVRVARQVAHPNVCRVYDIGEFEGQYYVSMEFVDGEDLSSLLRRIGRVPREKGIDLIRQLAAGVAAAHELGVLHRDLKPANIMIDGRGRVRIMDFGLAGFADELLGKKDQAGTLAYMAPEQLAGKGPTTRSDVYSLGLVMYELITGRRAYESRDLNELRELQAAGPPPAPSTLVSDLDPVIERVVMWCLAFDPMERPGSGHGVVEALPGADPLAAALAAGETPSPEMVAAAGGRGMLSRRVGTLLLIMVLAGLAAVAYMNDRIALFRLADPPKRPVVLVDRAKEILTGLGHEDKLSYSSYMLFRNSNLLDHIAETDSATGRWQRLARSRPTAYGLWYRAADEPMIPFDFLDSRISWNDPPLDEEGMVRLRLDQAGRLTWLEADPPWRAAPTESVAAVGWDKFFGYADIDPDGLREVRPRWLPQFPVDQRQAWEGTYPEGDSLAFRVEAGSMNGRHVYFRVFDTAQLDLLLAAETEQTEDDSEGILNRVLAVLSVVLFVTSLGVPAFFGWRNIRAGRADTGSALRLGLLAGVLTMASGALTVSYLGSVAPTIAQLYIGTALSLFVGTLLGLGYLAAEPYLRRYWPDLLISWTRLMAGRYRDPRVGRDVLIGATSAILLAVLIIVASTVPTWFGTPMNGPSTINLQTLMGGRHAAGVFINASFVLLPIITVIVLLLFLLILRRKWVAVAVAFVLMVMTMISPGPADIENVGDLIAFLMGVMILGVGISTLIRFGLLAYVAMFFFFIRMEYPITFDTSAWYSSTSILVLIALVAIVVYAFRIATSGRAIDIPHDPQTARTLR